MYGRGLHDARRRMGHELAKEHPCPGAHMVMPIPDGATPAAIGFAEASGIPYGEGVVKNRYIGRTFIQPDQRMREAGVRMKLMPIKRSARRQASRDGRRQHRPRHHHRPDRQALVRRRRRPRSMSASPRRPCSSPASTASTWRTRKILVAYRHTVEQIRRIDRCNKSGLHESGRPDARHRHPQR